MTKIKDALLIVNDVLSEIQDGTSNKVVGIGITTDEYVETQLMVLADLLNGYEIIGDDLKHLQMMRNKLNRKISALKKANLKN